MPYADSLQLAIQAARSGDRNRAYDLLLALIRQNSKNFLAWLWLSELAQTRQEQAAALEQAQALCPPDAVGRRDLQPYLNRMREAMRQPASAEAPPAAPAVPVHSAAVLAAKAAELTAAAASNAANKKEAHTAPNTNPLAENSSASDPFFRIERLARIGKREEAIRLLGALLKKEPQDERAWLLLSELETDPQEKQRLLRQLLAIYPEHPLARQRLEILRQVQEDLLQRGQSLEEAGENAQAIHLYEMVIAHSRVATERIEANRRIAYIQLRQEADQAQPIHPTLNLLRVTVGPMLLFGIMVFIQSGLNLNNASLLAIPGFACVLAGSFLVSVTTMRPMHPKWIALFGAPGSGSEPQTRLMLNLAGWLCMLAPFSVFLIAAGFRFSAHYASMLEGLP